MIVTSSSSTYSISTYLPDLKKSNFKDLLKDEMQFELTIYFLHALKNRTTPQFSAHLTDDKKSFKITVKGEFIEPASQVIETLRNTLLQSYHENTRHSFNITAFNSPTMDEASAPAEILNATALLITPIFKKLLKTLGATEIQKEGDHSFQFTWSTTSKRILDEEITSRKRVARLSESQRKEREEKIEKHIEYILSKLNITEDDIFHKVKHAKKILKFFIDGRKYEKEDQVITFPVKVITLNPYTIMQFRLDFNLPKDNRVVRYIPRKLPSQPPFITPYYSEEYLKSVITKAASSSAMFND